MSQEIVIFIVSFFVAIFLLLLIKQVFYIYLSLDQKQFFKSHSIIV